MTLGIGEWGESRRKRSSRKRSLKFVYDILSSFPGCTYKKLTQSSITEVLCLDYSVDHFSGTMLAPGWITPEEDFNSTAKTLKTKLALEPQPIEGRLGFVV